MDSKKLGNILLDIDSKKSHLKFFFDNCLESYWHKEKQKDAPAGPWRTDTEYGHLLGIKGTAGILLGDDDELVIYMNEKVQECIKGVRS